MNRKGGKEDIDSLDAVAFEPGKSTAEPLLVRGVFTFMGITFRFATAYPTNASLLKNHLQSS